MTKISSPQLSEIVKTSSAELAQRLEAALGDAGISLETLRQNVCSAAADLAMFKTDADKPYSPWVRDILAPGGGGSTWCAIISGPDSKSYEIDFTIADGKPVITGDPREVVQEVTYVTAAMEQPRKGGKFHGAAAATSEAYEASEDANDDDDNDEGTIALHEKAADLHDTAAKLHADSGDSAMAKKHKEKAKEHRDKVESLKSNAQSPMSAAAPATRHPSPVTHFALESALMVEVPTKMIDWQKGFMVMAGGIQTMTLGCEGQPLTVTIDVNAAGARALQAQLEIIRSKSQQKPFNCFDHGGSKGKTEASSWPEKFFWKDAPKPGIFEAADPSDTGDQAIKGKRYRGFSLTFYTNAQIQQDRSGEYFIEAGDFGSPEKPAQIICPPGVAENPEKFLNMGTLTNKPASVKNEPLFASQPDGGRAQAHSPAASSEAAARNAGASSTTTTTKPKTMKKVLELDAAALQERCEQLEASIAELTAKSDAASRDKLTVAEAELEAAQAKLELAKEQEKTKALEASETKRKEKEADAAVETMKSNGVIPMLDKELAASYREKFIKDPSLIPLMTAMRGTLSPARTGTREMTAAGNAGSRFGHGDVREGAVRILTAMGELCKRQMPIKGLDAMSNQQRTAIAREIAMIYRNEVRGKVLEADGMGGFRPTMNPDFILAPLEAAADTDTLGTLAGTLVTQRFLDIFMYKLPLIANGKIMTDFSDQPSDLNQTVSTRKITIPSPVAYDPTLQGDGFPNGWVPTTPATSVDVNITMDELIGTPIQFDLAALSSTQRQLFSEQAPAAAYANALYLLKKIYNVCTAANFNSYANVTAADANGIVKVPIAYPTYVVALIDFARSKISEVAAAFDANEVPDEDRSVLLNAAYYNKATTDPSLVTFFAGQQSPEIVTQGNLPDLAGFTPIKAPNFPGTNNRFGIFLQKNGLLVKTRLPANLNTIQQGSGNGTVTQIVHPETGVAMMVVLWTDHRRGYTAWLPCFIIGAAKGDPRGGIVGTTQ